MAELPKAQPQGMPSGRTSMLEPPATDLLAIHPACSGKRHHQPCRRPHERKLGDQTKDVADKEPREERSCGRSLTSLYNGRRPPRIGRTGIDVARAGGPAVGGVDDLSFPVLCGDLDLSTSGKGAVVFQLSG